MRTQTTDEHGRIDRSGNKADLTGMDKTIDRLRKVLSLTNSPNENEAASAAAKLQEMLTEHNLSIADLEAKGQKAPDMRNVPHDLGKAAFKWKLDLAEGIAEFYYCAPIVDRRTKSVAFIGRPENVEALQMLYAWVIDQIKAIATTERRVHFDRTQEHIDPLRWQVGFGEGAVIRPIERMREMKARQEEDAVGQHGSDVQALVLHRQSEVSDWLEEHMGYRVDGKPTKRERENEARWAKWEEERVAARAAQDEMRIECEANGDMAPYYEVYPHEHPDVVAKRKLLDAKYEREYRAKERRNASRRTGGGYRERKVDWYKVEQSHTAKQAGKEAAGKVNLQPFITGNVDRTKVGG